MRRKLDNRKSILTFEPATNSYRVTRQTTDIDTVVQGMVAQGLAVLATAAILWTINEVAKAWTQR